MPSLVVIAASVFAISCGKTERYTYDDNGGKYLNPRMPKCRTGMLT